MEEKESLMEQYQTYLAYADYYADNRNIVICQKYQALAYKIYDQLQKMETIQRHCTI